MYICQNVYFSSNGSEKERHEGFEQSFKDHTKGRQLFGASLTVYGHKLLLPIIAAHPIIGIESKQHSLDANIVTNSNTANITRFTFSQLCDDAVGAADFIAISQLFDIVFLDTVPQLKIHNRNQVLLY